MRARDIGRTMGQRERQGQGLVVLSACSRAGIVNFLTHTRSSFPETPLHAVLGGLHLSGPYEAVIARTVDAMKDFGLQRMAAGHCTGWRAMAHWPLPLATRF